MSPVTPMSPVTAAIRTAASQDTSSQEDLDTSLPMISGSGDGEHDDLNVVLDRMAKAAGVGSDPNPVIDIDDTMQPLTQQQEDTLEEVTNRVACLPLQGGNNGRFHILNNAKNYYQQRRRRCVRCVRVLLF
jgi:hypothetical protein